MLNVLVMPGKLWILNIKDILLEKIDFCTSVTINGLKHFLERTFISISVNIASLMCMPLAKPVNKPQFSANCT